MLARRGLVGLFAVLALTAFAADAIAQAWPQALDGYYLKISASYLAADEEFNSAGRRQSLDGDVGIDKSFREISFGAYFEYGLWQNFTVVAQLPFKISTSENTATMGETGTESVTNGGLGDLRLSIRTPLLRGPFAVSLQSGVKLPLGYEREPDNTGPAIGTGQVDGTFSLLFGHSLHPLPAYVGAGIGYSVRGGSQLDDEVLFNLEGGYNAGPVFLKLRFDGVRNTSDPQDVPDVASVLVIQPNARNENVYKLIPEIDYSFSDNFALAAELFHVFAGKNTMAGTTYALGLVYSR
ncbi:MAG: transporter [Candidatus Krumholzibacteria bacterium]|nr:transporter [Candidatus Krumholzibacteria bacterium]